MIKMKENEFKLKGFFVIGLLIIASFSVAFIFFPISSGTFTYEIDNFSSYDDLRLFLKDNYDNYSSWSYYGGDRVFSISKTGAPESSNSNTADGGSIDYSKTNIQVEGVDEPDIVKTDGSYIYVIANSKVFILKAYPSNDIKIVSEISFSDDTYASNLFINEGRLIVFCSLSNYFYDYEYYVDYWWGGSSSTIIYIYDITDKSKPELINDIEIDGWYFDSRMIDEYVYAIVSEYSYEIYNVIDGNESLIIPKITINNESREIPANDIYYVDIPEKIDMMTHVISINIFNDDVKQKSFLLSDSQNMYVSKNNIYITSLKYHRPFYILESNSNENTETTIIHKISIKNGEISYDSQGEVPGHILNQFSMDEYNDFFRIATTVGYVWSSDIQSSSSVYVLNENLEKISEIEGIAPGEQIYSARFMGEKLYLVTFKKIDPFFTIDLSDPYNPEILGKLKIPGYSDYLHPYDENHIIGIGKDTVEASDDEEGWRNLDFAWYQGIKIALFDVTDFDNPKEVSKIIIGDRGTDSPALHDHKAFLFDKNKELLVIPVTLYEIDDEIKEKYDNDTGSIYGEYTFQGAFVYHLSVEKGFELEGKITHMGKEDDIKTGFYPDYDLSIQRSLYINDILYTISNKMINANNLDDLNEIKSLNLD
jgi:uncharacterized secreted protein with C-terminal beta-propeller domain